MSEGQESAKMTEIENLPITPDLKKWIIGCCHEITEGAEVAWDRCTIEPQFISLFGWIARKDEQRDFVLILFEVFEDNDTEDDENDAWMCRFITSSAKYSGKFAKNMHLNHTDCLKVSEVFGGL